MIQAAAETLRRKTLRWSYWEGALYAVMVGSSESFAIYYAIKQGLSPTQIATLTTVPVLLGSLANWIIPLWIKQSQLKKGLAIAVFMQVIALALLLGALFIGVEHFFAWILLSMSLYWIGGMAAAPLWLDWIAAWLPTERLGRFLSRRNAFVSLVTVTAYLLFAFFLHSNEGVLGYTFIFGLGLVARSISWTALLSQASPKRRYTKFEDENTSSEKALWAKAFKTRPLVIVGAFTIAFKFATMTGTTYFSPYLINDLKFSLVEYSWISAIPFLGRAVFLASWGEAIRSYRAFLALEVSFVAIALIALGWSLFPQFGALMAIEACTGIFWAGFELAIVLIFQNFAPGNARAIMGFHLALMNLASLAGAYFGSYLLTFGISNIEVFRISALIRFMVAIIFIITLARTEGTKKSFKVYSEFLWTVLSIRPALNQIGRIVPLRRKS